MTDNSRAADILQHHVFDMGGPVSQRIEEDAHLQNCPLCGNQPFTILTGMHWKIVLNDDQRYLGRCYFALLRHETDITALTDSEVLELWKLQKAVKSSLDKLFAPDHYNFVFLMNMTAHVHAHVIPRYATEREFGGYVFSDGRLGEHYDYLSVVIPPEHLRGVIAETISKAISEASV
jgi:diadenosine tetraphosphate (Ap4A) HIT family hydrolase